MFLLKILAGTIEGRRTSVARGLGHICTLFNASPASSVSSFLPYEAFIGSFVIFYYRDLHVIQVFAQGLYHVKTSLEACR